MELRKFTVPEFVFGTDASALCGSYARKFGAARVFLVSDEGLRGIGVSSTVQGRIEAAGLPCTAFHGVSPNPRDTEVRAGTEAYLESQSDLIVAVGGGSVMDCAKAIGLCAANRTDILAFEGVDQVPLPGPPLICIPSTAGTAADVSQFAIINATQRGTKIAVVSKKAIPDVSLVDPELTCTMDSDLTAATGMDVLSHALEAFVSRLSSPVTDLNALEAMRLVGEFLPRAVADGTDREARNGMMLASLLAGLAFSNANLGAVHALSHALGGALDLPHGLCNALLLPAVAAFNSGAAVARYETARSALEEGFKRRGAEGGTLDALLAALRRELGLAGGLSSHGLSRDQIPALAKLAYRDPCLATNPREPRIADLEDLYAAAL